MILETAVVRIVPEKREAFEQSFKQAAAIISSMKGCRGIELNRCMEHKHKYLVLVRWEALEDHTVGFRGSEEHQLCKALLHPYYASTSSVEHYKKIELETKKG